MTHAQIPPHGSPDSSKPAVQFTPEQMEAYLEYFRILANIRERCIMQGIDYYKVTEEVRARRKKRQALHAKKRH